jgi:hypothetical protein
VANENDVEMLHVLVEICDPLLLLGQRRKLSLHTGAGEVVACDASPVSSNRARMPATAR